MAEEIQEKNESFGTMLVSYGPTALQLYGEYQKLELNMMKERSKIAIAEQNATHEQNYKITQMVGIIIFLLFIICAGLVWDGKLDGSAFTFFLGVIIGHFAAIVRSFWPTSINSTLEDDYE